MLGGQQSVGGVVSDTVGTTQQVMTSSSSHRRYVLLDIFLIFYALAECIVMTVVTFTTAHFLECFNFLFLLVFPSNFSCIWAVDWAGPRHFWPSLNIVPYCGVLSVQLCRLVLYNGEHEVDVLAVDGWAVVLNTCIGSCQLSYCSIMIPCCGNYTFTKGLMSLLVFSSPHLGNNQWGIVVIASLSLYYCVCSFATKPFRIQRQL